MGVAHALGCKICMATGGSGAWTTGIKIKRLHLRRKSLGNSGRHSNRVLRGGSGPVAGICALPFATGASRSSLPRLRVASCRKRGGLLALCLPWRRRARAGNLRLPPDLVGYTRSLTCSLITNRRCTSKGSLRPGCETDFEFAPTLPRLFSKSEAPNGHSSARNRGERRCLIDVSEFEKLIGSLEPWRIFTTRKQDRQGERRLPHCRSQGKALERLGDESCMVFTRARKVEEIAEYIAATT